MCEYCEIVSTEEHEYAYYDWGKELPGADDGAEFCLRLVKAEHKGRACTGYFLTACVGDGEASVPVRFCPGCGRELTEEYQP